ncbi:MAG TPA: hypothetical protein VGN90_13000 [Pyrinomonadaceae bacterium]|nr:hypothetical protein [Pyrinomonadaceae bacterium]
MAKYNKKRARELQHDKFRDTAGRVFDRLADRLEGRGREILYVLGGIILVAILVGVWLKWSHRKSDEAQRAMGRAIAIATAPVATASPAPGAPAPVYNTEQDRARKAAEEFQKVAAKYGDPYKIEARYLMGANMLYFDREKAMNELAEVSKSSVPEAATLAKLALAQAKEADGKFDDAAKLYSELASQNSTIVTAETANVHLADVYEKQGKRKEAAEILFNIVEASRKLKDSDGEPIQPTGAARDAGEKLQKLDPERYAKLTPQTPNPDSPF